MNTQNNKSLTFKHLKRQSISCQCIVNAIAKWGKNAHNKENIDLNSNAHLFKIQKGYGKIEKNTVIILKDREKVKV